MEEIINQVQDEIESSEKNLGMEMQNLGKNVEKNKFLHINNIVHQKIKHSKKKTQA